MPPGTGIRPEKAAASAARTEPPPANDGGMAKPDDCRAPTPRLARVGLLPAARCLTIGAAGLDNLGPRVCRAFGRPPGVSGY